MLRDTMSLESYFLLSQRSRFFEKLVATIRAFLDDPQFDHLQRLALLRKTEAFKVSWFCASLALSMVRDVARVRATEVQVGCIGSKVRIVAIIIALVQLAGNSGSASVFLTRIQFGGTNYAGQWTVVAKFKDFETRRALSVHDFQAYCHQSPKRYGLVFHSEPSLDLLQHVSLLGHMKR